MNHVTVIAVLILTVFVISVIFSIPAWLLWNWLVPTIFGLTEITLLQAWGLIFLSGLFFKSNTSQSK